MGPGVYESAPGESTEPPFCGKPGARAALCSADPMRSSAPSLLSALSHSLREAALIALGCAAVALGANAVRKTPLPLVQREPYQLFVACPDSGGSVEGLDAADPRLSQQSVLWVDARSAAAFSAWHAPGAVSLVYDFLEPVSENALRSLLNSRASLVAVYGDGDDPDSGAELAKELSGKGVRGVVFVRGGAKALSKGATP